MRTIKNLSLAVSNLMAVPAFSFFEGDPVVPPVVPPIVPPGLPVNFPKTQEELNALLAKERKATQGRNQELSAELERRKALDTTTEEERTALQTRIDSLNTEFQTDKELKEQEIKKLNNKYQTDEKKWKETATTWEDRYTSMLVENDLLTAASNPEYKAFNPEQIVDLLRNKTRKQENLVDGKPSGTFSTKVKFVGEKDGQPVELDLSPREAVKLMSETPNKYGNLFNSGAASGLGDLNNPGGGSKPLSMKNINSQEDYQKNRDRILKEASANKGS